MAVPLREFKVSEAARKPEKAFDPATSPNLYVPLGGMEQKFGDGVPVNTIQVRTRGDLIKNWFGEEWKEGSLGTVYKAWFFWALSGIGIIVFYGINLWVAAVFAYLMGYFWSTMLLNYAWSAQWFKGKALISTK